MEKKKLSLIQLYHPPLVRWRCAPLRLQISAFVVAHHVSLHVQRQWHLHERASVAHQTMDLHIERAVSHH